MPAFTLRLLSQTGKIKMYRILPVVVYVCKTWSLTLREDRRLRVIEDRVLRRMMVSEREGGAGDWRKMRNVILVF